MEVEWQESYQNKLLTLEATDKHCKAKQNQQTTA